MFSQYIIWIKEVKIGKNSNWLCFDAYVDRWSKTRIYKIDFCGTEVNASIPLTEEENNQFRELLVNDFSYPPYDLEKVKGIIDKGKGYSINSGCMDKSNTQ